MGFSSKLKSIHVAIIGVVLCVAVVVGMRSLFIIKPQEDKLTYQAAYNASKVIADKRGATEAAMAIAKERYRTNVDAYERFLKAKCPPISVENRFGGWFAYIQELKQTLGPKLEAWPTKTGVKLLSTMPLPAPPPDPNGVNPTLIVIPIGTVNVGGTLPQILNHIKQWNKFDRLVRVDPVSIRGTSPNLIGSYNLTVYIFPRGQAGAPIGGGAASGGRAAGVAAVRVGAAGGAAAGPGADISLKEK